MTDNKSPAATRPHGAPRIIPRSDHNVSRSSVSPNALRVLYRLKDAGYQAFLVGGCVRDIMLGRAPKDFDVATNALPDEVRSLFRNCRLVGRRFRLAHVVFGREIIEVHAGARVHAREGATHVGRRFAGDRARDTRKIVLLPGVVESHWNCCRAGGRWFVGVANASGATERRPPKPI